VERSEENRHAHFLTGAEGAPGHRAGDPVCSVVIPTYNGRELLARCLGSIARHRPGNPALAIEIVVADDGSTDGTAEMLGRLHPEVRLVCLEQNGGFCAAANAGLSAARGRFIQLLNNDTEVAPGWLEAGLAPFRDAKVGAVAPLVLVRADPTRVDSAGDSYALVGWATKRGHGQPAALWSERPIEEVFGASGSSAFYRAEALRRAGKFDPFLGSYYEDTDLAFRLRWAGYRCVFTPHSRVYHAISATYDHGSRALQRRMARNAEFVFWANLPSSLLAAALIPHLAFLAAQALWRLAHGRLEPFLLGKCDAIRAWPEIRRRRNLRMQLAQTTTARPHFALQTSLLTDIRNHLKRPTERSRARPNRA
jgi:GT2 family glycosyltransferase